MNKHKYLKKFADDPLMQKFQQKDKRHKSWKKIKKKIGFSPVECWNLDTTMIALLYERVAYYKDHAPVVMDYQIVEFEGEVYTQEEALNYIITRCESYLSSEQRYVDGSQDGVDGQVWRMWAEVAPMCWW